MASLRIPRFLLPIAIALIAGVAVPEAQALRPPVTWLKGEGNYTKAHRSPDSLQQIVVHVTEGAFWGSVTWLKNPRAHASSHFIVSRGGKIVQLVHVSDIAWHAGNWRTNVRSVGIEHEGFTYGPDGFTTAQYRNSARLTGWLARRALMPIDREHIIGHAQVPAPNGRGVGGASGHTDPGPRWNWKRYLSLVRSYAGAQPRTKMRVTTALPPGGLAGVVPWRARVRGGVQRVEFVVNGRVAWTDRKEPFAFRGGRGLNTLHLRNGRHVFELRAYGSGTRHDITRRTVVVSNRQFRITTAGARPWTKVRGVVRLRSRVWGAKATRVVFRVDGRRRLVARTPPYSIRWGSRRVRDGKHVLEVVAYSVDGRVARRRILVVVSNKPVRLAPTPRPTPTPKPTPPAAPVLRLVSQSVMNGQTATGLVLWRVTATAAARVEFLVDGVVRGTDVAAPYTLGWNASAETPGPHRLTARAVGAGGKGVEATITVTVPSGTGGSGAP